MLINFLYLALNFLYSQSNAFIFYFRCSLAQECPEYDSALKWMGYNGETCTKITQVYPEKIQRDKNLAKTTTVKTSFLWLITTKWSYFLKWVRKNKHKLYTSLHFRYHYIYLTSQPSWDRTNVLSMAMGRRLKQQPTEPLPTWWSVTLLCIMNYLHFLYIQAS